MQFHLNTLGLSWRLLNDDQLKDIRFTLDNMMKKRTAEGIGKSVRKAQVLTNFDEELLWNLGLLGTSNPTVLLNTLVFLTGKGCALHAGKEHRALRVPPFESQFQFLHDNCGNLFIRYREDVGLKTNKGGLKHRQVDPKVVDVYPIGDVAKCPVGIFSMYLDLIPKERSCKALYLKPKKKFRPGDWFYDRPVGENTLRDVIKELCKSAGIPGFFSNYSLRSTSATVMYQGNIDEQVIQEVTGHRSLAVHSYKKNL